VVSNILTYYQYFEAYSIFIFKRFKFGVVYCTQAGDFRVQEILMKRVNRRTRHAEYLVRWRGYGAEHDSWEPVASLVSVMEHVHHFNHPQVFPAPVFKVLGFRV
jgi:hypothetical protein